MPKTQTKQTAATVKAVKEVKVIELVRRQGIYTGTLTIDNVEEVREILDGFARNDGCHAKQGPQAVEIEFNAKGGRKGSRDYCLRLPNINIEDLKKIGFTKDVNLNNLYTSK